MDIQMEGDREERRGRGGEVGKIMRRKDISGRNIRFVIPAYSTSLAFCLSIIMTGRTYD